MTPPVGLTMAWIARQFGYRPEARSHAPVAAESPAKEAGAVLDMLIAEPVGPDQVTAAPAASAFKRTSPAGAVLDALLN